MTPLPLLFADVLPPPLHGRQYLSLSFTLVLAVLVVAGLVLYLRGVATNNRLHPRHRWPAGKTAAFLASMAVTVVAVFSFIGVYQSVLFWDHMIQHLLLIMVASALLGYSSPLDLAWRATTGEAHRRIGRMLRSRPVNVLGHPVVAYVTYAVVIPVTHLTQFFDYTLTHVSVLDLEHLLYLIVGYMFWRQIFGSEPNRHRMHPAMRALFLFIALPIDTFVGLSLDNETHEIFPAYAAMHRTWGMSLIQDLHTGGVIMWVFGDTMMMFALIPVVRQWLRLEEREAERADRETDAIFGPPPLAAER